MSGKLILVPTPIGNLDDITLRALKVLEQADIIIAEDTRTSRVLLNHFNIEKRVLSHHEHNEHQSAPELIKMMLAGQTIAMISDAGTPGISDPGFLIVREATHAGINVECLPGATAFVPALVVSGLPCDRFVFEGFLPVKKGRQTRLKELSNETRTMVFYESPHRILKTLLQFSEYFGGERKASVSREISKIHEETLRGTLSDLSNHFEKTEPRGEMVVVVEGKINDK
jgi:16S rRNA (cytidine1402-2'-O)-methyltransferase